MDTRDRVARSTASGPPVRIPTANRILSRTPLSTSACTSCTMMHSLLAYPLQVYAKGKLVGGLDIVKELVEAGELMDALA